MMRNKLLEVSRQEHPTGMYRNERNGEKCPCLCWKEINDLKILVHSMSKEIEKHARVIDEFELFKFRQLASVNDEPNDSPDSDTDEQVEVEIYDDEECDQDDQFFSVDKASTTFDVKREVVDADDCDNDEADHDDVLPGSHSGFGVPILGEQLPPSSSVPFGRISQASLETGLLSAIKTEPLVEATLEQVGGYRLQSGGAGAVDRAGSELKSSVFGNAFVPESQWAMQNIGTNERMYRLILPKPSMEQEAPSTPSKTNKTAAIPLRRLRSGPSSSVNYKPTVTPSSSNASLTCPHCTTGHVYTERRSLNKHIAHFHRSLQRLYVCAPCNKTFTYREGLIYHERSVHQGLRYLCGEPGCDYIYATLTALRKHKQMRRHHSQHKVVALVDKGPNKRRIPRSK